MKTDRELLELAARAAGINALWYDSTSCMMRTGTGSGLTRWNPLADDGDALRLAVVLRINITPNYTHEGPWKNGGILRDPYAATRREIVQEAAQSALEPA